MRLATHARTLKVHATPCKDRKVSIGYDYSLYSRFVCSLSDVSRFPYSRSTQIDASSDSTTDERKKKKKKTQKVRSRGLCATRTCTRTLLFVDVVGTDVPTNADRMERENIMIPFSLLFRACCDGFVVCLSSSRSRRFFSCFLRMKSIPQKKKRKKRETERCVCDA